MAKKSKVSVPDNVCDFSEEEQAYISHLRKRFRFFIDLQTARILIPTGEALDDDEELICEHLYNNFGIDKEFSDDARILKVTVHKTREKVVKKEPEKVDITKLIKAGLKFSDTRKFFNHEIVKTVGTKWQCRIVNNMQSDWFIEKLSFLVGIGRGIYIIKKEENGG